jgi:hypothetical protein
MRPFFVPTGDKSAVDVVAHEIAHSWMGNLVTTRNWVCIHWFGGEKIKKLTDTFCYQSGTLLGT